MSNNLLWQPSNCITIFFMFDIVAVGNKYDDDDDGTVATRVVKTAHSF